MVTGRCVRRRHRLSASLESACRDTAVKNRALVTRQIYGKASYWTQTARKHCIMMIYQYNSSLFSLGYQRDTARICCWAPCCCGARRPPLLIAISPARTALSSKPAAAAVEWWDRQTEGRTLDRFIDRALQCHYNNQIKAVCIGNRRPALAAAVLKAVRGIRLLLPSLFLHFVPCLLRKQSWTGLCSYRVRGVDGSCAKHLTVESYTVVMLLTVILIIISIPSRPHSFIPGLKPSFSANPSYRSLPFLLQDWLHSFPDCLHIWAYPFF